MVCNVNKMASTKNIKEKSEPIRVFLRIRPLHDDEKRTTCVEIINSKEVQINRTFQKRYLFDGVFHQNADQKLLYKTVAQSLISDVLAGYSCSIFAFGPKKSGKTYTMFGSIPSLNTQLNDDHNTGLIPRFMYELFEHKLLMREQFTVRCSYLELYNEELRDLFSISDDASHMRIYENQRNKGEVTIHGLSQLTVENERDGIKLLIKGQDKRCAAVSSSHTIFTIMVHSRETSPNDEALVKIGKINFVDLGGSENINKPSCGERRGKEAITVNQSIVALGRVIKELSEKSLHAPFRESKLTKILRDSLGGKTKTTIVATASPSLSNLEETMNSLDYALKAKTILNQPEINQHTSQALLVDQYIDEISFLRKDLEAAQTGEGVILDTDNYNKLIADQAIKNEQLSTMASTVKNLGTQLKLIEEEKENFQKEQDILKNCMVSTQTKLATTSDWYNRLEIAKGKQEIKVQTNQKTAEYLHKNLANLLEMVKSSSYSECNLHDKLQLLYNVTKANSDIMKKTSEDILIECNNIQKELTDYKSASLSFINKVTEKVKHHHHQQKAFFDVIKSHTSSALELLQNGIKVTDQCFEKCLADIENIKQRHLNHCLETIQKLKQWQSWNKLQFESYVENVIKPDIQRRANFIETLKCRILKLQSTLLMDNFIIDTKTLKDDALKQLEKINILLLNKRKSSDNLLTQSIQCQEIIKKVINTEFQTLESLLNQNKEQDLTNTALVKNLQSTISTDMQRIMENFKKRHDEINTESTEIIDIIEQNAKSSKTKMIDEYKMERVKNDTIVEDKVAQLVEQNKNSIEEFVNDNLKVHIDLKNDLSVSSQANSSYVTEQKIEIESTGMEENTIQQMCDQCDKSSEHHKAISHSLHNIISLTKHQPIVKVQSTGNTPMRVLHNNVYLPEN